MKVACYIQSGGRGASRERAEIQAWLTAANVAAEEVEWYADKASVPADQRPGFEQLRATVARGDVQAVVIWKLDRLGTRLQDGIEALADWCARGLKIVIVAPRLEFSGDVGRPLAGLLLGLAEMEREYRRERQAAGIADAKKRGAYRGRSRGATKASPARVRELRTAGLSVTAIAEATGVSKRTVTRYLGADASESCPNPGAETTAPTRSE